MNNIFLKSKGKEITKFSAHKPPTFETMKGSEFVQYGYSRTDREWNNLYPDYLIYLYNRSAKNNSIINGKNKYIVGQGWTYSSLGLPFETKGRLKKFISEIEKDNVTRDLSLDRTIFGGFAAEMILSKDKKTVYPSHLDFSKVRQFKQTEDKSGELSELMYGYTSDWSTKKPENNKDFETLHPFTWDIDNVDEGKRYIVYYKDYRPDSKEYPLPDYVGAVPYIEADYEISNFVLNNVKNGFSAGYLVNFYNGEPSEEQKKQVSDAFDVALTGTDNAGKVVKSFNEDKDSGVEITPLAANGQDDRYINLNKQVRDEIFTGHNFNPAIVGISDGNGFNNNADEIFIASEMFQNTYVATEQSNLEDFFNAVVDYNGLPEVLSIVKLEVISEKMTETEAAQILTIDERRERRGYAPIKSEFSKSGGFSFEEYFSNCGTDDSKYEFLDSREMQATDIKDAFSQADEFKKQYFASKKALSVLNLLNQGNTLKEISSTMQIDELDLDDVIGDLQEDGLITETNEVTPSGKTEIENNNVFVVYKYALRNDAPKLETESRDFCKDLVNQSKSKSWTRQDIALLDNGQLPNVFASRGGFYNNPTTGVTTPFCRHVWQQRLVRLR